MDAMDAVNQFTNELPSIYSNSLMNGIWQGVKLLAPYFGIVIAYYIIRIIIKQFKKKKK